MSYEIENLLKRDAMCLTYRGPRAGSGRAIGQMMGWVQQYFPGRQAEIIVENRGLPLNDPAARMDPNRPVELEVQFVIDASVPRQGQFPPGFSIRTFAAERIVSQRFSGSLPSIEEQAVAWIAEAQQHLAVRPLYRQRFIHAVPANPMSPDWLVEAHLVLV